MPLNFSHGSVQWLTTDTLNATKVVTGLGFRPLAIRFYWVGLQSNSPTNLASGTVTERRGVGFAVSATSRRCVGTYSVDNDNNQSNCGSTANNDCVVVTVNDAGTIDGKLDVSSFDTDGFTLIVDDVTPANITVFYEVWGGTDILVAEVGDIAEPAATGTQNYTVNGFTSDGLNQVVMFAGVQSTNAVNTGQGTDSGLCVGFASSTSTTNNVVVSGNADDASATSDTDGYCRQGECIAQVIIGGGTTVDARANLSAWGTNQFTLNWSARALSNRRNIFLAIKGGTWQASSYTIAGNTLNSTTTVSDLPFYLRGLSIIGRMTAQDGSATATAEDRIGFGSASSTTARNSIGVLDRNGRDPTEIYTIIRYDSVLSFPSTAGGVQSTYDVNNFGLNSFQIIVDTAGGVASEFQGYLAFGDTVGRRILSVGHPFIV